MPKEYSVAIFEFFLWFCENSIISLQYLFYIHSSYFFWYLRTYFVKVASMLFQQLKSTHSIKIEADNVNDTSSVAVANYEHSNTSILRKQSMFKLIRETPAGDFISLSFVADTEPLLKKTPVGHFDNDIISIQNSLHLSQTETHAGHFGNNQ